MANLIGKVKFKHCNRVVNVVAHELAKFSFLNKNSRVWDDDPPKFSTWNGRERCNHYLI